MDHDTESNGKNLFDNRKMSTGDKVGALTLMTGILSGGLFLIGSGAGLMIDELAVPPSNDNRAGQEIALQQYDRMFNVLAEQRQILDQKNMEFASLAAIDQTPDMLQDVVGLSDEEKELYGDVTLAKQEIGQAEDQLHNLAEKFAYSAVVDERLNESNVRDLFNRFEKDIGTMESVAGIEAPDYADLDQSRARIGANADDYKGNTAGKARAISDDSNTINGDIATDIAGPLGGLLGIAFILWLVGGEYAGSNYRKRGRKPQKFNH
ncbi:MAG: hypothetical protein HND56_08705 [Pseudomonadota bacterium]|nr:hypothetical protein [Pseudomonadota bacterium]QKK05760.1 MAG: hypothetical protein HND56_08705 [Pseudomonadota bacterium]